MLATPFLGESTFQFQSTPLVGERRNREWIVGVFLALLETIKRGLVVPEQDDEFGDVRIVVRDTPNAESPLAPGVHTGRAPDELPPSSETPSE